MESNSPTDPPGKSNQKSWNKTYMLVLLFNAMLIVLFYFLSLFFNVK